MTERPINLRRHEVPGILDGRQTQLRRPVKDLIFDPYEGRPYRIRLADTDLAGDAIKIDFDSGRAHCPYGKPGDRLFGREIWMPGYEHDADDAAGPRVSVIYRADSAEERVAAPSRDLAEQWRRDFSEDGHTPPRWRSPIAMPRWASRILLEVTDVRVERVQDGEGETGFESRYLAEGINRIHHGDGEHYYSALRDEPHPKNWVDPFDAWRELWTSIHGPGSWDANPWTWVIGFRSEA
ncbi:MAG TPA: hypothetical protein VMR06_08375 [Dokdonella sp.]|uniref:hypothetical protein n=1 Tax=Dokdonella sp. TaxID=2291710 RepID=UPI002C9C32CD|nr:hypothetical protein [Dokdonella sp.]HUD41999.1 hypothetical protein [Dokdonella sp.]